MNRCLLCGAPLNVTLSLGFLLSLHAYQRPIICNRCRNRFIAISKDHRCHDCGRPGDFSRALCSDCQRWRTVSGTGFKNYGLYRYNGMMKTYMHRYKFQGDYRLRFVFRGSLSSFVRSLHRVVVPIPVHQNTYQRRGFNQVRGLLNHVKWVPALRTSSIRKAVPQSHKTRAERLKLPQPFKMMKSCRRRIEGRKVVVVDDVYTTGTTIRHAARLLKLNGAKSVVGVTLAR